MVSSNQKSCTRSVPAKQRELQCTGCPDPINLHSIFNITHHKGDAATKPQPVNGKMESNLSPQAAMVRSMVNRHQRRLAKRKDSDRNLRSIKLLRKLPER